MLKKKSDFKFKESENTACIICSHILDDNKPILYVCHDKEDSMWQFLCGENDHLDKDAKLVSLKQVTEIDNSINDLFEVPLGVSAERTKSGDKWKLFRIEE